jgi:exoribonuclease-2
LYAEIFVVLKQKRLHNKMMFNKDALAAYKKKQAIIKDCADGKISILLEDKTLLKVRDKDVELVFAGQVKDFKEIESRTAASDTIREIWELFIEDVDGTPVNLKEFCEIVFNEYSPSSAWSAYCLLNEGFYFSGSVEAIIPRSKEEVTASEVKRAVKERETGQRASFLEQLKNCLKSPDKYSLFTEDSRFIQDVEALSYGKSSKSRTMNDLGLSETPEEAHALLLKTGFWTAFTNPHPVRFGISLNNPSVCPEKPPVEERRDLTYLDAFAVDNSWSNDPDDALSIETDEKGSNILYVHIADPASSVPPESPVEKEARDRGATVYLPENTFRMLADDALVLFALGLCETSPALTFKITLNQSCEIMQTEIFPSVVRVKRMTYEQADREIEKGAATSALCVLLKLAQYNYERRLRYGAVNIELPESHITVVNGTVKIESVPAYRSAFLVRECMLIAGEGAGTWAAGNSLPFPYIIQEVEITEKVHSGMAGSYQLRRCMRPRVIQTKPGRHQGLGLDSYTQVTSPLRRYTDLLAHMQIRAFLRGGKPLSSDEVLSRIAAGEAAATAATYAERASRSHWTYVYLSDKKDSIWDAVALEKKGNRWAVIIPSLALETQVSVQNELSPNENIKLILKSVNIPKGEAVFVKAAW